MYQSFRTFIAILLVGILAIGPVTAQEITDVFADEIGAMGSLEGDELDTAQAEAPSNPTVSVHLQDDGSLSGRFRVVWPTGKTEPANAKVEFAAGGEAVESTQTNDLGHFVVEGLTPGDYIATASIEEGSTDFNVEVLAFDEGAQAGEMFMDATLTPMPEYVEGDVILDGDLGCGTCGGELVEGYCDTCGIIEEEWIDDCGCGEELCCCEEPYYDDYAPACGGFAGGGGCGGGCGGGGGGGLGWLLGAAGLATGITALVLDDDDDNQQVSPAQP